MQNFGSCCCLAHISLLTRPLAALSHVSLDLDSAWMGPQVTEAHVSVNSYFFPNPAVVGVSNNSLVRY